MQTAREEKFVIWLDSFRSLTYAKRDRLLALYRGEGAEEFVHKNAAAILAVCGEECFSQLKAACGEREEETALKKMEERGVAAVACTGADSPEELRRVPCPPHVLYAKGNLSLLKTRKFSVVGSRKSIPLALAKAEEFSAKLAEAGFTVVTGLADGADSAAVKGALSSGKVVSVLAGGFCDIYPRRNEGLFREIVNKGLALSEYPPDTPTERYHFPVRNRIIAGLGEGLLVVSAGKKSGTAYTAGYADALSKQIFALPYNVNVPSGEGCNELIRRGAYLTERAEDILSWYGMETKKKELSLTEEEKEVYDAVKGGEIHIEEIGARTGRAAYELLPVLSMLEIKKVVLRLPGNFYCAAGAEE